MIYCLKYITLVNLLSVTEDQIYSECDTVLTVDGNKESRVNGYLNIIEHIVYFLKTLSKTMLS